MSQKPASIVAGPATTNTLVSKWYVIIHFFMIWLSSLLPIYLIWSYASKFYALTLRYVLTLPFHALGWYFSWVFCAIFVAKFFLIIANLFHKPREGYFPRTKKNKDYRFWSIRAVIKKFAFFICNNFPLPWMDIIAYKIFGVKVPMKTGLFDAWVDTEFLEIGDNCIIGQGSLVMSTMVTRDFLIIKKIEIGDNCVIGGYSVVSPGSKIPDNVVIGTHSATTVNQELEEGWVYLGVPARKYKKNDYKSHMVSELEKKRTQGELKQYLTIDEVEEMERKEKRAITKKVGDKIYRRDLERLMEQKAELLKSLEDETDEVQVRRTKRKLAKLEEKIKKEELRQKEPKKSLKERLRIRTTNLEKMKEKEESILAEIEEEDDEEKKQEKLDELKEIRDRIEKQEKREELEEKIEQVDETEDVK